MQESNLVKQPEELKVVQPARSHFPLPVPRPTQIRVIDEIEKAYSNGYRFVILEGPVGSGKSAIAITMAKFFGWSHIITPRKSLQNQYYEDFKDHIVMMKGRSSYPCTFEDSDNHYKKIIKIIQSGDSPLISPGSDHCGNAPCLNDKQVYTVCTNERTCPYQAAIFSAQNSAHIVHNLHSFIFQTAFGQRFGAREILIIDEAHEVENTIRDFIAKKFVITKLLTTEEEPGKFTTITEWCDWLLRPEFTSRYSKKPNGDNRSSDHQLYIDRVEGFREYAEVYKENFVVKREIDTLSRRTKFEFIPKHIGKAAQQYLFEYAKKILLMSGTIYSKEMFCSRLGINPDQAYFIRVGSSFPVESRPIYMKDEYMVDTSHANWVENFPKMIDNINTLLEKFPDVKGLIHSPSYMAAEQITHRLRNRRILTHDKHNFLQKLEEFLKATDNKVFISPVCSQGMDFKDDRARFQIILRVPYPNTNDPFLADMVKTDYPWFNYQALITFGQQIGRINRSDTDFGVTILLDSRFEKFISRNKKMIPGWVKEAIKR
jgi:ATP-dependent DNA helicase DinG